MELIEHFDFKMNRNGFLMRSKFVKVIIKTKTQILFTAVNKLTPLYVISVHLLFMID